MTSRHHHKSSAGAFSNNDTLNSLFIINAGANIGEKKIQLENTSLPYAAKKEHYNHVDYY